MHFFLDIIFLVLFGVKGGPMEELEEKK